MEWTGYIDRNKGFHRVSRDTLAEQTRELNELLKVHGLKITRTTESPTINQFRAALRPDSNINRLLKMRDNFSIALNGNNVRVFRDGAELVIETAGAMNTVYMGDLYNDKFRAASGLTIMLGKDAQGNNLYTDLHKATHLLVAGMTGSGKSIFLHTVICSLLMKHPDIEIYGFDPKQVEFINYKPLANFHYISETSEAVNVLANLCREMDRRYDILAKTGHRDIDSYARGGGNMKPIVVIIEEFADLMLTSGKAVEESVVRLAQKARACGIHLVIATQRPTANVITGLIKTNIPTRICLKVKSGLDSRIILDQKGGEELTGHGDMLYQSKDAFTPIRIQGCYISEDDTARIVRVINESRKPYEPSYATKTYFRHLFLHR